MASKMGSLLSLWVSQFLGRGTLSFLFQLIMMMRLSRPNGGNAGWRCSIALTNLIENESNRNFLIYCSFNVRKEIGDFNERLEVNQKKLGRLRIVEIIFYILNFIHRE